jgi:solute carrier family 39 (zinc transporter), member 1/2/3
MNVELIKLISVFVIFGTGILGGVFSGLVSASKKSALLFSWGNAFAGGVFLGAGLIHMLPDAQSGFKSIVGDVDYPWFALICGFGFLFIFFLERVLLNHSHEANIEESSDSKKALFPYVLMFILSIHSIITGIALGIENQMTQAAVILLAVLAHKGTASFALGVSLLRSNTSKKKFYSMISFFSFMTPLGVILGYLFSILLSGNAEQRFEAIFDALAAGTFLYIAIVDILNEEFATRKKLISKFFFLLIGFGIMAVIAIWT